MSGLSFPDGLTEDGFLRRFWQKEPLLMQGALPGFHSPLSADELAGLACEEDVESRIVTETDGLWRLRHGPFSPQHFGNLGSSHWSLLIQDLEKHLPDLAWILQPFGFLPSWRVDDLMVSFAAPMGSVGPHVDQYDVFLLQGSGRRRWRIDTRPGPRRIKPDCELSTLADFEATSDWVLAPGDVLYLPPGVPHFGTAMAEGGDCITYSIGFRAPSVRDLVQGVAEFLCQEIDADLRYGDPDLACSEVRPGHIAPAAIRRLGVLLGPYFSLDEDTLGRYFGKLVTEPKAWLQTDTVDQPLDEASLRDQIAGGAGLARHSMALFAWSGTTTARRLYVDGQCQELAGDIADLGPRLCSGPLHGEELEGWLAHSAALDLLIDLLNRGKLVMDSRHEQADP